jgi:hypothetical protein
LVWNANMELFSKRKKQPPKKLVYDIPEVARTRILAVFRDLCYEAHGGFRKLLEDAGKALFKEYGFLCQSSYIAARRSDNPTIEHFYCCDIEQALDFIEVCFQQDTYDGSQTGVDEINRIFNEYGIGFELTPFIRHEVVKETSLFGRRRTGTVIEYEYPRIIEKSNQLTHQEIVQPSMELLSDSRFRVANSEMLKAHTALRNGDYEDAITLCGSAFESVLKTIIDFKGWNYSSSDTCAKLIGICRDNNLFPPFYCPAFEAVGTIRNKLSDAHGRGPKKTGKVTKETAEHMVHMTLTHTVFLAKCTGIKK